MNSMLDGDWAHWAATVAQSDLTAASLLPIPGEWIVQGGAVGLLLLVALMVFRGHLIPKATYQALERDRDMWRDTALKAMGHSEALMPAADIAIQVTKALGDATATTRALGGGPGAS